MNTRKFPESTDFVQSVRRLCVIARTTGGTAGRDEDLCAALDRVEAGLLAALAAPPVEQQAARATVYIQRDHLEKAQRAPFLCRVEPTQRLPDFVPMHPTEQPSQDAERLDWLDTQVKHWGTGDGGHQHLLRMAWDSGIPGLHRTRVRDAIDAARAAQAQGTEGGA